MERVGSVFIMKVMPMTKDGQDQFQIIFAAKNIISVRGIQLILIFQIKAKITFLIKYKIVCGRST